MSTALETAAAGVSNASCSRTRPSRAEPPFALLVRGGKGATGRRRRTLKHGRASRSRWRRQNAQQTLGAGTGPSPGREGEARRPSPPRVHRRGARASRVAAEAMTEQGQPRTNTATAVRRGGGTSFSPGALCTVCHGRAALRKKPARRGVAGPGLAGRVAAVARRCRRPRRAAAAGPPDRLGPPTALARPHRRGERR